jgi:uncharacterized membrane protein (UPF0127 family)
MLVLLVIAIGCGNGDSEPSAAPSAIATVPAWLTRITFVNEAGAEIDLFVEVADSPEERTRGLMFRESLPEDQGMLFVFEQEGNHSFWMKDTTIPLSIVFIEGEGEIIGIQDMEPLSEELHAPGEPYLYAVEVNQGWFQRNGISTGSGVRIARSTPSPSAR